MKAPWGGAPPPHALLLAFCGWRPLYGLFLDCFLRSWQLRGPFLKLLCGSFSEVEALRRQKCSSVGFYEALRAVATKVLPLLGDFWALFGTRQETRNRPKIDLWRKRRSWRRRSHRLLVLFCHALHFCSNSDRFLTKI